MIDQAMTFLKDQLNQYLQLQASTTDLEVADTTDPKAEVKFINGDNPEAVKFAINSITPMLVNLEEERMLRPADRFEVTISNGLKIGGSPEIRLNLFVLFVASFQDYMQSMMALSRVIRFFQSHSVFDHKNSPNLSQDIERLIVELNTLSFNEQNEIWNALRRTYLPSALYKIRMIVFRDIETLAVGSEVDCIERTLLKNDNHN